MTRKIIASGYSYSGSSALFDFLADYNHVAVFPGGELRMFRASHGLKLLYGEFKQHKRISPESIGHFRKFSQGRGACLSLYDDRANANVKRLRTYFGSCFDEAAEALIAGVSKTPLSKGDFLSAMQGFVNSLCAEVAMREGATHVVIDQALRPWMMQYLPCFDDVDVFIVRRDIRDQIVDRVNHGFEDNPAFLNEMMKRVSKVEHAVSKYRQSASYRIQHLWFEDFVTNAAGCRDEILSALGIPASDAKAERLFHPERSVRNIGMYKTHDKIAGYLKKHHENLFYGGGGLDLRQRAGMLYEKISVMAGSFLKKVAAQQQAAIKKPRFEGCQIPESAKAHERGIVLHSPVNLGEDVVVRVGSEIGAFSYFGDRCFVGSGTKIGAYCAVARDVEIGPSNHPTDFMSTHTFQYSAKKFAEYPGYREMKRRQGHGLNDKACVIGSDVWIGAKAVIRRGVNVGTGAIIGAGSVVVKDVPPYAIVGGVPAKIIRYRFDEVTIERLLASKWWELKPADMSGVHFADVPRALEEIEGIRAGLAAQNRQHLAGEFKNDFAAGRKGVIWFRAPKGYADRDALACLARIEILSVNKMKTYKKHVTTCKAGVYEVAHASYDPKHDAYKIVYKSGNGKKFRKPIGQGSLRFRLLWDALPLEKAA